MSSVDNEDLVEVGVAPPESDDVAFVGLELRLVLLELLSRACPLQHVVDHGVADVVASGPVALSIVHQHLLPLVQDLLQLRDHAGVEVLQQVLSHRAGLVCVQPLAAGLDVECSLHFLPFDPCDDVVVQVCKDVALKLHVVLECSTVVILHLGHNSLTLGSRLLELTVFDQLQTLFDHVFSGGLHVLIDQASGEGLLGHRLLLDGCVL